jgi:acyl-CoA synthetase (AMP-forming)/AMP-acid ligase II
MNQDRFISRNARYQPDSPAVIFGVGVPDDTWGEAVKAVVVLRAGQVATAAELVGHCRALLADFKKPRSIDFVTDLPKNPNGKLARKLVREPYGAGHDRRVG